MCICNKKEKLPETEAWKVQCKAAVDCAILRAVQATAAQHPPCDYFRISRLTSSANKTQYFYSKLIGVFFLVSPTTTADVKDIVATVIAAATSSSIPIQL